MKLKILSTDLDGTLIYKNNISEKDVEVIRQLHKNGIKLIFSTGRAPAAAIHFAEEIGVPVNFVCFNGAVVINEKNEILYKKQIDFSDLLKILKVLDKEEVYYHLYDIDNFYSKYLNFNYINHLKTEDEIGTKFCLNVNIIRDLYKYFDYSKKSVFKIMVITEDKNYKMKLEKIFSKFENIKITSSSNRNFEMVYYINDKMSGVNRILVENGFSRENLIAIGDHNNDLTMVKGAKIGIAMGNGIDELKQAADFVTFDLQKDGFSYAMKKYFDFL